MYNLPMAATPPAVARGGAALTLVRRIPFIAAILWLFLIGLTTMKDGAAVLAPALQGSWLTDSLHSALGFGWISAMLVMSGSPVAASSLALLDGGSLSRDATFMMLTGSRMGASFVVLALAFIYALKGHTAGPSRRASLSIGIFALLMTALAYLPGAAVGLFLLHQPSFDRLPTAPPPALVDFIDAVTARPVAAIDSVTPELLLFPVGLAVLLVSLRLIDRVLPTLDPATFKEHRSWKDRPWIMFGLGSLVAFVTMSVSVALTILVPAVAKGYLRRRHAIGYIAGANVTTLGDTLITAMVLGNADAVLVVLAELLGVLVVTLVALTLFRKALVQALVRSTDWMLESRWHVAGFVASLFVVPIVLIAL